MSLSLTLVQFFSAARLLLWHEKKNIKNIYEKKKMLNDFKLITSWCLLCNFVCVCMMFSSINDNHKSLLNVINEFFFYFIIFLFSVFTKMKERDYIKICIVLFSLYLRFPHERRSYYIQEDLNYWMLHIYACITWQNQDYIVQWIEYWKKI